MRGFERGFVVYALVYIAIYSVVFLGTAICSTITETDRAMLVLLPFHFLGMVQNFVALVLTIRDLYKRPFPNPNSKLTWLLLILLTGGIGWIVYLFRHALKPRPAVAESPTEIRQSAPAPEG